MTDIIFLNKAKIIIPKDQVAFNEYHCVEMKPAMALPIYQFKLHLNSNLDGAYLLIKDNSEILQHLKPGEKVDMVYHPIKTDAPVEHYKTIILNITDSPFKGHFKIALSILE